MIETDFSRVPSTALTLSGSTGPLAAIAFGDQSNPPVLALHGWLDNAATFIPLAQLLDRYYIVALDFAGHGESAHRPPGCRYHLVDHVADVAHARADLGWDQFDLVGHSLGAGVAMVYAAVFSPQVGRLLMIDGLGPTTGTEESAGERLRKSIEAGLREPTRPGIYRDWEQLVRARRRASPISQQGAETLLQRGARQHPDGFEVRADPRLKDPSALYLTEELVLRLIRGIQCPALLILANDGVVKTRKFTAGRVEAFSRLTVNHLEGGHHLHLDSPAPVADAIKRFLIANAGGR